jgi:hypothetical protein
MIISYILTAFAILLKSSQAWNDAINHFPSKKYKNRKLIVNGTVEDRIISFQEDMIHYIGASKHILDETDEIVLRNGTLRSKYDLWMYKNYMSEKAYKSSVLTFGKHEDFTKINGLFQNDIFFTMITLGGSISCGVNGPWDNYISNRTRSWPNQLERMLRLKYSSSNIKMHNLCIGGVGADVWVDNMLDWKSNPNHIIHKADLIFVETAVNDVKGTEKDKAGHFKNRYEMEGDPIAQENEMLIRLLMLLPKQPYLIWIGAASRTIYPSTAIRSHLTVTLPYGVPHFDLIHGFMPIVTNMQQNWYWNIFHTDKVHISEIGQKILAFYILKFLNDLMSSKLDFHLDKKYEKKYPNVKMCKNITGIQICMYKHIHILIHVFICIHLCKHMLIYICIYTNIRMYIYVNIYM